MRGFTLTEVLVVIAVIGILATAGAPSITTFLSQSGAHDAAVIYSQMLRRAQSYAIASRFDSPWGVWVATSTIVLFKGTSYAARDVSRDEVYSTTISFSASGMTEVVFARLSGLPSQSGTTTLSAKSSQPIPVGINAKGVVSY